MKRPIKIAEYDPNWINKYKAEIVLITKILESEIVRDHHIGSTSVIGLSAKPIIDILLEVKVLQRLDLYDKAMISLGYEPKGEYGIPGRRFFMKGGSNRTHHIHAFSEGDVGVVRHIAFRDYLRFYPETALKYAKVKKLAAIKNPYDINGYMEDKNKFIKDTEQKALAWYSK